MNPAIVDVRAAYERVHDHPASITIDRTGVVLPKGGHFQGIQRFARSPHDPRTPQMLVITSSSDDHPYFVICTMAEDGLTGRASPPVIVPTSYWNHAGGCQVVDHYLVVGIENSDHEIGSQVQFWDLSGSPTELPITIAREGKVDVSSAGAVGLSSFGNGAALAVASFNARTVDFYSSEANPFTGTLFKKLFTWKDSDADKTGWIDENFGHYQNVNLITQTDGKLFMVAFDLGGGTDWMDLFSVHLEALPHSALKKLAKKKMYCTNGCTFNDGSGIFIPSSEGFEVYAVKGKSGDHATGTTIYANHFPAR